MNCNNCGKKDFQDHTQTVCYWTKIPLNAVKCKNCGLVFLNPRPDKSFGAEYFDHAYSNTNEFESHSYYRDHEKIFTRNTKRFGILKKSDLPNTNVLDFGAGQGHFVKVCIDNGWNSIGIEQSLAGINSAKQQLNVILLPSVEELHEHHFGAIALWDVIEHLENPKEVLMKLAKFLHKEGVFVIETSNINSYDYLINRKKWSYWHVDHYFYYSNFTLEYLLNSIGFEIVNTSKVIEASQSRSAPNFKRYLNLLNIKDIMKNARLLYYLIAKRNVSKDSLVTMVARRKDSAKK